MIQGLRGNGSISFSSNSVTTSSSMANCARSGWELLWGRRDGPCPPVLRLIVNCYSGEAAPRWAESCLLKDDKR